MLIGWNDNRSPGDRPDSTRDYRLRNQSCLRFQKRASKASLACVGREDVDAALKLLEPFDLVGFTDEYSRFEIRAVHKFGVNIASRTFQSVLKDSVAERPNHSSLCASKSR